MFSGFGTRWLKYDTWLILYVPMPPGRMCSTEGGGAGGGGFSIVKISALVSSLAVALLTCSSGCRKSCVWRKPPVQAWKRWKISGSDLTLINGFILTKISQSL